ncbi:trifunctional glycosyltransferase/class I SAM-dependent methyltransferase/polysaccharide deacetylase [Bradyrhizobium liaoningense]|uniref:trifunctional glycosyltransferase/class I SAM-dependent methyltransferase/polysaccharide deacetylase n=1 Tax=Bradyrhizobium liaoningense TaxID=43992 RepID=UPI001BA99B72|nr:trifunctional glycosyltransferase/class I SAM-dependent methyltransferase/polysaccharide deacetylase [Bradyrhizobium liaoningense]MBR1170973.1 glycosyltransferase [Bradyrhizobium liaoningense]
MTLRTKSFNRSVLPLTNSNSAEAPITSIVIPARNASGTIRRTLQSLVAQSDPKWEALIIDDASHDGTAAIVAEFVAIDARFVALNSSIERGAAAARNVGISQATGDRLLFLDSDDWIAPSFLEKMNAALDENPGAVAAYCDWCRIFSNGDETPVQGDDRIQRDPIAAFASSCATIIHSVLVRKAAVVAVDGFDTSLRTCEDWDLWQRVAKRGGSWVHVRENLSYYSITDKSLTQDIDQMMTDAHVVIGRGFATMGGAAEPPTGAANEQSGSGGASAELAYAYYALWCAAFDCGRGRKRTVLPELLAALPNTEQSIDVIVGVLLDAVGVGARLIRSRLASGWSRYEAELTDLIRAIGRAWNEEPAALQIQYRCERMVLHYDDLSAPRLLNRTLGVRADLRRLPTIRVSHADRMLVHLCVGREVLDVLDIGVLGDVGPDFWIALVKQHLQHLRIEERAGRLARLRIKLESLVQSLVRLSFKSSVTHQDQLQIIKKAMAALAHPLNLDESVSLSKSDRKKSQEPSRDLERKVFWEILFDKEDPWNYGSAYELEKYTRQLDMLPVNRPARALELACAEGYFTQQLAPKVGRLLAADISSKAVERARVRCRAHHNVEFMQLDLSIDSLPQNMDLIVCSEVLYYLRDEAELASVANRIAEALRPGGYLLTAHAFVLKDNMSRTSFDWENPYGAETIARVIGSVPGLTLEASTQTELYRIDRFRRLTPGEIAPNPRVINQTVEAPLDTEVARFILWNGAVARRSDLVKTERRERIPVLMYHRIATDGPARLAPYRLSPAAFQGQMLWLRRNGYHAINSEQLAFSVMNNEPFVGRPVLITFDDGYQDFAEQAWPILQRNDFSAEIFVVTDLVGKRAEWDVSFGPPEPLMDAATIVSLAAEGVSFGSHLASHPRSNGLSTAELAEELLRSRIQLETWLNRPVSSLAAPFGCTDQRLRVLASECGYTVGFSTVNRAATLKDDLLDLPRIEVRGDCSLDAFVASLEACR